MTKIVKFKLSESQMTKLAHARKNKTAVTLRLGKNLISDGGVPLEITKTELKKIHSGGEYDITISATRVRRGGFLPMLLAALPTIASVIGGISGLTGIASNIKTMVDGSKGHGIDHYIGTGNAGTLVKKNSPTGKRIMSKIDKLTMPPPIIESNHAGDGFISDLNLPLISPIAKIFGLGAKKKRSGTKKRKPKKKAGSSLIWK